jgi:hypothetical protein
MEIKTNLNPFSKIETLDLKNISDQDFTIIFHIKIRDLPLYDIFIDDHNHYWSISKELILQIKDKNPLTNAPFDDIEWIRIQNAINWYNEVIVIEENKLEKYNKRQVFPIDYAPLPLPVIMNNFLENPSINNDIEILRNRKNCYITPLHGRVGNTCYCYPLFSYDKNYECCYGNGKILCNEQILNYSWNNPLFITFKNNNNYDRKVNYFPFCCCLYSECLENCILPNDCCCLFLGTFFFQKFWFFDKTILKNKTCCFFGGIFSYESFISIGGIITCNCNNLDFYTPICCCKDDLCMSILGYKNKNCLISPILCENKNYYCLFGIPIWNKK